jgi:YD repeat-containing protein
LTCVGQLAVSAQTKSTCVDTYSWTTFGNPPGPGWQCYWYLDHGPFLFQINCTRPKATCPPPAAPPVSKCPSCGRPISLTTGNTFIEQTDVKIPGLSGGLTLSRTWNSMWGTTEDSSLAGIGLFGGKWRSTFEERIFVGNDGYYKYVRADGSIWSFAFSPGGWTVAAPANALATLDPYSNQVYMTLTFENGEKRIFNYLGGGLTSIIDRNGNTTQLTYDGINRLVTVADPGGRHLYFAYGSSSSYLITGVTSDVGISLSFSYDSQGRLTQVTKPDSTIMTFEYDSNSLITAVKDNEGKILESHTYDSSGRGLTSSRANGVEAVTVSY